MKVLSDMVAAAFAALSQSRPFGLPMVGFGRTLNALPPRIMRARRLKGSGRRGSRRTASTGVMYSTALFHGHARKNERRRRQFRTDDMGFTVHSGQIVWGAPANAA